MTRSSSKVLRRSTLAGVLASILPGGVAIAEAREAATEVRGITLQRTGDVTVVAIEGDGALPEPAPGTVENPPRIFFDFPGLLTRPRAVSGAGDPLVRRVRAAVNSSEPLVTRVVIDLHGTTPFQIDRSALADGRLTVRLAARNTSARPETRAPEPVPKPVDAPPPPVPSLPAPPAASTPTVPPPQPTAEPRRETPSPPATATSGAPAPPKPAATPEPVPAPPPSGGSPPAPRRGGDKYRQQLGETLDKARTLRSVLSAIDRSVVQPPDVLEHAAAEFDNLRRSLSAVKPPEALRPTHDMVVRACTLGAMAARLRAEANRTGDEALSRNAASAAAGALLLIDRACVELGCTP